MARLLLALLSLAVLLNPTLGRASHHPAGYKAVTYDSPMLPLWPYPSSVSTGSAGFSTVDPNQWGFACASGSSCSPVILNGFARYMGYLFWAGMDSPPGTLSSVSVTATSVPPLQYGVDESYSLYVPVSGQIVIKASTEWGALRGLETLSQLVQWNVTNSAYYIPYTPIQISDTPRFGWRGLLIDSARHFLPVPAILRTIDAMTYNKFNVLHWHLTDDQSFPFYSTSYPTLSGLGAYSQRAVYSLNDIDTVVEYAMARGVRVVPEFDTPAHTASWSNALPQIFANCPGQSMAMNPVNPALWPVLTNFFAEVAARFPDNHIHVGGDEVNVNCYAEDPTIAAWMKAHNTTNINDVQAYHEQRVHSLVTGNGKIMAGWEEIFTHQGTLFPLPSDTVVDIWMTDQTTLVDAVTAGYPVIWSRGSYLDQQIPNPNMEFYLWLDTWMDFYANDPTAGLNLTPQQQALVLGGSASQWGEQVDATCIDERIWPRACGTAERLWSPASVNNTDDATSRLMGFRCHMVRRGIMASPIAPDWCELGPLGVL